MFLLVCYGQGQALSLRIVGIFLYHISRKLSYISNNLTAAASHRPTLWDVKFIFTGDRTFSLPCKGCGSPVETSAFNAEAPTEPAGETVGCRRQLGGIVKLILYGFIKSLSHFFVPKKRQLPLQGSL